MLVAVFYCLSQSSMNFLFSLLSFSFSSSSCFFFLFSSFLSTFSCSFNLCLYYISRLVHKNYHWNLGCHISISSVSFSYFAWPKHFQICDSSLAAFSVLMQLDIEFSTKFSSATNLLLFIYPKYVLRYIDVHLYYNCGLLPALRLSMLLCFLVWWPSGVAQWLLTDHPYLILGRIWMISLSLVLCSSSFHSLVATLFCGEPACFVELCCLCF